MVVVIVVVIAVVAVVAVAMVVIFILVLLLLLLLLLLLWLNLKDELMHLRLPHFPANKRTNPDRYKPVTKPAFRPIPYPWRAQSRALTGSFAVEYIVNR